MATNSSISITPGSGKNVATYSVVEGGSTKEYQRIIISDSNGAEYTSSNPFYTYNTVITPGGDAARDIQKVEQQVIPLNLSVSTSSVISGAGKFFGFVVNNHTSGTLKFWDSLNQSGTVLLDTMTFASGPSLWLFPVAFSFITGLSVTVGGTINFTVAYKV